MGSGGITNHDALRIATIKGCEALELDTDLASLEIGKIADIFIINGNPLENLRNTNTLT
jgi:imidazolonepropionase-like amidohydrolase